jgi:hypothetical protein
MGGKTFLIQGIKFPKRLTSELTNLLTDYPNTLQSPFEWRTTVRSDCTYQEGGGRLPPPFKERPDGGVC